MPREEINQIRSRQNHSFLLNSTKNSCSTFDVWCMQKKFMLNEKYLADLVKYFEYFHFLRFAMFDLGEKKCLSSYNLSKNPNSHFNHALPSQSHYRLIRFHDKNVNLMTNLEATSHSNDLKCRKNRSFSLDLQQKISSKIGNSDGEMQKVSSRRKSLEKY